MVCGNVSRVLAFGVVVDLRVARACVEVLDRSLSLLLVLFVRLLLCHILISVWRFTKGF